MGMCFFPFCCLIASLTFVDISMPVMDGITASKRIREFEEENKLRRSTIMAVTSITCSEKQEQAFAAGMDDYLVKPLSLRDLRVILR
jgi:CheY-like chemotaxis protein